MVLSEAEAMQIQNLAVLYLMITQMLSVYGGFGHKQLYINYSRSWFLIYYNYWLLLNNF